MAGRLLDTGVLILLRDAATPIEAALDTFNAIPAMSLLCRVELEGGVARPGLSVRRRAALDLLLAVFPTLEFDRACADIAPSSRRPASRGRRRSIA